MNRSPRIVLFVSDVVGLEVTEYLLRRYRCDICAVVLLNGDSSIRGCLESHQFPLSRLYFWDTVDTMHGIHNLAELNPDYFILAWWPYLLRDELLGLPLRGTLNTHPSLLPHGRGKHPNFWSLVEGTAYGVSLHYVTKAIDAGDIAFQTEIKTSWLDSGETLYRKGQQEMVKLFIESYPKIRVHDIPRMKQPSGIGSFHLAKDLEPASEIDLDQSFKARDLLNLIRARTFPPYPGCRFEDSTGVYEVSVKIRKISNNT